MQTVLFSLVPPIDKTLAFVWSILSKTLDVPERLCMVDAKVVCFKISMSTINSLHIGCLGCLLGWMDSDGF